jgi:hypothetical protein
MRRSLLVAIVSALAVAAAACSSSDGSSSTTPTAPTPTAGTETFIGQMAPGGSAFRVFTASATGTVNVTLTTTDPASTLVGLGIGIPGTNTGQCDLLKTVQTRQGSTAQITASVEAGAYCAGAFDVGAVGAQGVLVTITVAHP